MSGKLSLKKRFFCKILEIWMKSLRISGENLREVRGPGILALWHRDLFAATAAFRGLKIVAFISPSGDGELLAQVAADLGYRTVRGSSSENTLSFRKVLRSLQGGDLCAMALDGPRGPAGREKPGTRWLAARGNAPMFRVEVQYEAHFTLSSWDHAQIPLPFSKVTVRICKMS